MRLLNIRTDQGERVGVRVGEQVLDIQRGAAKLGVECGSDIRGFLGRSDWRELAQRVAAQEDAEVATPREEVEVGAIVPNPQKVIFCGGNTHSHLKEAEPYTHAEPPQRPPGTLCPRRRIAFARSRQGQPYCERLDCPARCRAPAPTQSAPRRAYPRHYTCRQAGSTARRCWGPA